MPVRTYILIITLNVNGVSVATKNRNWLNGYKNKTYMYICCLQESHFRSKDTYRPKGDEKMYSMQMEIKIG